MTRSWAGRAPRGTAARPPPWRRPPASGAAQARRPAPQRRSGRRRAAPAGSGAGVRRAGPRAARRRRRRPGAGRRGGGRGARPRCRTTRGLLQGAGGPAAALRACVVARAAQAKRVMAARAAAGGLHGRALRLDVAAPPPARLCCSLRVGSTGVLYRCQGLLPVASRAFGFSNRIKRIKRMERVHHGTGLYTHAHWSRGVRRRGPVQ